MLLFRRKLRAVKWNWRNAVQTSVAERLREQLKARHADLIKDHDEYGLQFPQLQEADRMSTDRLEETQCALEEVQSELKRIEKRLEVKQKEGQMEQQHLFDLERDRESRALLTLAHCDNVVQYKL
jgi:hypothetical protein